VSPEVKYRLVEGTYPRGMPNCLKQSSEPHAQNVTSSQE
jgi:hypothetical protein